MKNCVEIKELLSAYLDNELHENERKEVVKHLESCISCKEELEQLRDVIEAVNNIEEVELPEGFEASLHKKLVEASRGQKYTEWAGKGTIFKLASGLVAGFILVFAATSSGYFSQFANPAKNAYVSDTQLSTVNKNEMAAIEQKQLANSDNQAAGAEDRIFADKKLDKSESTFNEQKAESNTAAPTENIIAQDNLAALSAPADTARIAQPDVRTATDFVLLADNTANAESQISTIVKNNGGTVSSVEANTLSIVSVSTEKDVTIQIPKESYDKVVAELAKLGNVEPVQQEIIMNATVLRSADAPKAKQDSNMMILKVSIKQK